jgi:hypothetical protein
MNLVATSIAAGSFSGGKNLQDLKELYEMRMHD